MIFTGQWTINGVDTTLVANRFSLEKVQVIGPSAGPCLLFTGIQPSQLHLQQLWLDAYGTGGTGLYVNNSGTGSYVDIDIMVVSHNAASGDNYCLDLSNCAVTVRNLTAYGTSVQIAAVRSGASLTVNLGKLNASGSEAIHVHAGGDLNLWNCTVSNTTPNSSGIYLESGAVAYLGVTIFNIPIGTGYAIDGVAGSTCYYVAGGNMFMPGSNTTINPNVTMIPFDVMV